ncbi:MAG TPA: dienelactone hydrolase family protein [Acidimicrobiales bacterium]|nr:dienelactone hydrolase family protein [Acidimicrobiales bacterium]
MTVDLRATTVAIEGHGGDHIEAYLAEPLGVDRVGGVVVIHHLPGYDEATKEITRKFAAQGYLAILPNLYSRDAPGASSDDAAALVRSQGGVPDARIVGDVGGAVAYLRRHPSSNAKVGVIGYCSGGRQTVLSACNLDVDAAVDCYGAFVMADPPADSPFNFTSLAPILDNLSCPLLGLFGADDKFPTPEQGEQLGRVLAEHHKHFESHVYEGAGHAFFAVDRPSYRPEVAVQAWGEVWDFFGRYLSS